MNFTAVSNVRIVPLSFVFTIFLTSVTCAVYAAPALPGASKPPTTAPKAEPAAGLTANIIANKQTYSLDPSRAGQEFRTQLADLKKNRSPAPPTPAVDLTLRLTNSTDKDVEISVGGDATQIQLKLEGPGAVTVQNNVMMTMEFRVGKPLTIPAGKTYDVKITSLSFGMRGISGAAYWTEPGEYTLSATFICSRDDGTQLRVASDPVKLKVVKE